MEAISLGIAGAGAVFALAAMALTLNATAAAEIRRRVEGGGRQVVRLKAKWVRSPFTAGLTPLAVVYRVTTRSHDETLRVKLYAYDPGRWFSRTIDAVRQFSGGVWRDA
jgi:hypothetical protein